MGNRLRVGDEVREPVMGWRGVVVKVLPGGWVRVRTGDRNTPDEWRYWDWDAAGLNEG